jgi:hypothetical protein
MKRIITIVMLLGALVAGAQESAKMWCGDANVELSAGVVGEASDHKYCAVGVAGSYGLLLKEKFYVGLGLKPSYIFSSGDHEGFFMPIYGEFRYHFFEHGKFGIFGIARGGYSPVERRGAYAHLGCGVNYKRWQFGIGTSYQYAKFQEDWFNEIVDLDYNLVFSTISVGYRF